MEEWIEQLARTKPFRELDGGDRETVLAHLSEMEYEHLHRLLLAAPLLDTGPEPPPALRARLLNRMPGPARPRVPLPLRLGQAAALVLLGAAVGWWGRPARIQEHPMAVLQVRTDTVYREKIVWKDRVVVRERVVYRELPIPVAQGPAAMSPPVAVPDPDPFGGDLAPAGASLKDNPALMDFFVEIK